MPKKAKELSAIEVSRLTAPGLHFVGSVSGLALQVTGSGARSWILRATVGTRRRDIGLGGFPDVTLAGAKESARIARAKIKEGIDPVEESKAKRSALEAIQASAITFGEAAAKFIAAHESGWKNAKHAGQWTATLETYAFPTIGKIRVSEIETAHVITILESIWTTKTETASRLRGRIESVLDWATVRGYRKGENPARWRGHLDKLLPARSKVQKVEHHAALDYRDVGAFMVELRKAEGMGAKALEFAILTAARSGEVRGATWSEIDEQAAVWTIPAERMKAEKEQRVPLSDSAVELLRNLPRIEGTEFVFPNSKEKPTALSDMTLTAVLRRMDMTVTAHGFRSTFRDWAGETTAYPREVIEHALAHQIRDKAEAAYARGTLFDKRRRLMADWAKYCATVAAVGSVTPIRSSAAA
jgi:integrase